MAAKKQVLGRGLGALLQSMETTNPEIEYNNSITASIAFIPILKIEPNPNQPRKEFDSKAIEELSQLLREMMKTIFLLLVKDD